MNALWLQPGRAGLVWVWKNEPDTAEVIWKARLAAASRKARLAAADWKARLAAANRKARLAATIERHGQYSGMVSNPAATVQHACGAEHHRDT